MTEHPAEIELRQRELHHFEVEQDNAELLLALDRVEALCIKWDGLSKGETATTRQIRDAVRGKP